jgi:hypothetical protein
MTDAGFDAWARSRREEEPGAGFADRVVERVRSDGSETDHPVRPDGLLSRLLRLYPVAAAAFAGVLGIGLLRTALTVLVVLFTPASGY